MPVRTVLFMVAILYVGMAGAVGTIEVPKGMEFTKLEFKSDGDQWQETDTPNIKDQQFSLPEGEYRYAITLPSTAGSFRSTINVIEGGHHYIHQIISPDRKKLFSWSSTSSPDSAEYKVESEEAFCQSIIGYGDKPQYALDACVKLADSNNPKGLFGLAYIHEKSLGQWPYDAGKASEYYLRAYRLGIEQAGVSYFMLNQDKDEGRKVLFELADNGHVWSIGAASRVLSSSNNKDDQRRSRVYAEDAIDNMNPDGFSALANLAFNNDEGGMDSLVESAAWFNLYMVHNQGRDYSSRRFTSVLEAALDPEAMRAVPGKTQALSNENLNSGLYLVLDTDIFAELGAKKSLSILVNKQFSMSVVDLKGKYALELMPSEKYYLVTLNVEDEYFGSTTFKFERDRNEVRCLALDTETNELKTVVYADDKSCPASTEGLASLWEVMSQYN